MKKQYESPDVQVRTYEAGTAFASASAVDGEFDMSDLMPLFK